MPRSLIEELVERGEWNDFVGTLSEDEADALLCDWSAWGRPDQQMPPGDWDAWFVRAGRGFGKTRSGAEAIRRLVTIEETHGRVAIVAPTAGDCRDILIEGESGLLAVHPPDTRPKYEPSKRRLTWPNGAIGTLFSGEEPDRLRGPQHDLGWLDEPASLASSETLDNLRLGLRLGMRPRLLITGTPRPRPWLRDLSDEAGTVTTTGSTYENIANLAPPFVRLIIGRYENTRLGRQELHAEWLDDVEGALWTAAVLEATRIAAWSPSEPHDSLWREMNRKRRLLELPEVLLPRDRRPWRTVVAVDPPAETAECGIIVASAPRNGRAGVDHCVVTADATTSGPPEVWGEQVVAAYRLHDAETVVVEANQGGDMCRAVIHAVDPLVPVKKIRAKDSKADRAEPISALYGKGWVHHVGFLGDLEAQLTSWVPDESKSPDRLDALVHAVTELLSPQSVARATAHSAVARRIR